MHAIEEILISGAKGELLLARQSRRIDALRNLARSKAVASRIVSEEELNGLAAGRDHRGVIFLPFDNSATQTSKSSIFPSHGDKRLVIILDGVTDPQNLGAILRSADQFSADSVIVPSRRSAHLSKAVVSTSSGASAWVNLQTVPNIVRVMGELKKAGYWLYGADGKGESPGALDLSGNIGLVMGSEGKGLSRLIGEQCDGLVRISTSGHVDSFNVSVACGILMYEIRRQQRFYPS